MVPPYLSDCYSKNPQECELLITDQPLVTQWIRELRSRANQALLSLEGSLPPRDAELDVALDSEDLRALVAALGIGFVFGDDGDYFDMGRLRYCKLILLFEDDPSGNGCRGAFLDNVSRFMPPLLAEGHLFEFARVSGG